MSSTGIPPGLQAAELWPIKAKGAVQRLNPMGDPAIEQFYHNTMIQGQFLERSIAEAQHWLAQKQQALMRQILTHTRMNSLAVNGQLSNPARAVVYAIESGTLIKDINQFQNEITGLIMAVTQNIAILAAMEKSMLGLVTQNLNSLANILQQICNWHLPNLASLPAQLADTIFHWNGVTFAPLSAFATLLNTIKSLGSFTSLTGIPSILSEFQFKNCILMTSGETTPTGETSSLVTQPPPSNVTTLSGLPLGTVLIAPPLGGNISQNLQDPIYLASLQHNTTTPTYLSPAATASSISPTAIATPFNVNSSMLGSLPNPSTIISNYQMPPSTYQDNIVSVVPQTRGITTTASLQKALMDFVNLGDIVSSNYDPNLTSEWLFYLNLNRLGRAGTWLFNFQTVYTTYITPSIDYLANTPVPWNCVVPSMVVNDAPTAIPLLATLIGASPQVQGHILWQLSYIEAALLGYVRNTTWDAYADASYVSGFTGTDLDYRATTISSTTTTITLGETTADYPVPCTFPSSIGSVLQEVIAIASINIQNTPGFLTTRPQYKFTFNQFAVATEVDRFSQFWREFNGNLQALLLQDPYLIQFVVTYPEALDSAIDPLGDSTIYNQLQADAATRNRNWTSGSALPPIPVIPIVSYTPTSTPNSQTGWSGTDFDPATYLSRPDIQQLPIPTQIAMLRTNLSYAATLQTATNVSAAIQASIQTSQAIIASFQNVGFEAEVPLTSPPTPEAVPVGSTGIQVAFNQIDFDLTGNITSPDTFTIQLAGTYAVVVVLDWGEGTAGTRTLNVFLNGTTVLASTSTASSQTGPTTTQVSFIQYFNKGDIITVWAIHGLSEIQYLENGSYISATYTDASAASGGGTIPPNSNTTPLIFTADTPLAILTAVAVGSDGNVAAIDPTTVQTDGMGNPIYPIATGVTTAAATEAGDSVGVATSYGGVYVIPSASFVVGGLLYAGVDGILTQDYATIVSTCQWTVVMGRAISATQFIYEPHIPNLMNLGTF